MAQQARAAGVDGVLAADAGGIGGESGDGAASPPGLKPPGLLDTLRAAVVGAENRYAVPHPLRNFGRAR